MPNQESGVDVPRRFLLGQQFAIKFDSPLRRSPRAHNELCLSHTPDTVLVRRASRCGMARKETYYLLGGRARRKQSMWRWATESLSTSDPEERELAQALLRMHHSDSKFSFESALKAAGIQMPKIEITSPSDHVSRWEDVSRLPLTSESAIIATEDGETILTETIKDEADGKDEPKTIKEKINKFIKILIPHIILISLLLGYLSLGATVLMKLETTTELHERRATLHQLNDIHDRIIRQTWNMKLEELDQTQWSERMRQVLLPISVLHEGSAFRDDFNTYPNITTKWTFPTALLYALTVLTTCGYGQVGVYTTGGQIFAVAFALIGIPLMFITAADIGKFLSETLLSVVLTAKRFWRSVVRVCRRERERKLSRHESATGDMLSPDGDQMDKLWFPIITYVSLICTYCSIGAVMFRNYEMTWPFVHAFHFGFNLIVTVGLGDIVVDDPIFLCLIVAYVIIGLSVVTMCVDLASTHLKAYFTKIHYFGRAKAFLGMSEDLKEMLQLLAFMKKKKGGKVTWNDMKEFLDAEALKPKHFEPHDLHKLRFIDETSSAVSTIRHNSCSSDLIGSNLSNRRDSILMKTSIDTNDPAFL